MDDYTRGFAWVFGLVRPCGSDPIGPTRARRCNDRSCKFVSNNKLTGSDFHAPGCNPGQGYARFCATPRRGSLCRNAGMALCSDTAGGKEDAESATRIVWTQEVCLVRVDPHSTEQVCASQHLAWAWAWAGTPCSNIPREMPSVNSLVLVQLGVGGQARGPRRRRPCSRSFATPDDPAVPLPADDSNAHKKRGSPACNKHL